MGAWKQFLASDLIVAPFEVNKGFSFSASLWGGSNVGIDYFRGANIPFVFGSAQTTGINNTQYQSLIYNSIKQLYYSNFLVSSSGDPANLRVLVPGAGPSGSGDTFIGSGISGSGPLYDNFLQSTLVPDRFFPTASGDEILVISIPSKIYGEYIVPTSFVTSFNAYGAFTDDGEGNLLYNNTVVGNVIYTQGIIIFTNTSQGINDLIAEISDGFVNCSFSSSMTIYETQYKCTIEASEYNATLNPSAQASGSIFEWTGSYFYDPGNGQLSDGLTGSYFSPYVTTVGLYDEGQNLIAVGKLSQPLPTSPTTDTTILVNLDF